jgi:hypothetical protein
MPHASIAVDEQLNWVLRVPELLPGATLPSSAEHLATLRAAFDSPPFMQSEAVRADVMVGAIARAVVDVLGAPPELPFIGEPFGGEGGTD